jgi:hypothetical protein
MLKLVDIEFLFGNYKLEQIADGYNSDHACIFDNGQMTHTLFGHQRHAEFDRLFWPDMNYISLHNVSNQSVKRSGHGSGRKLVFGEHVCLPLRTATSIAPDQIVGLLSK